MLEEMFGDLDYEDCWIEAFACSASLTQSRLVVHRTGRIARATLASIAIPGVAPPIVGDDGDLLVDGGVLNNLPAAVLSRGAQGAVLASDASPVEEAHTGYGTTPSNWPWLARVCSSCNKARTPSMSRCLNRACPSSIPCWRRSTH